MVGTCVVGAVGKKIGDGRIEGKNGGGAEVSIALGLPDLLQCSGPWGLIYWISGGYSGLRKLPVYSGQLESIIFDSSFESDRFIKLENLRALPLVHKLSVFCICRT